MRLAGLFTFADSAKRMALYQKFGYSARFLTAIMSAPAPARVGGPAQAHWSRYSALTDEGRSEALGVCRGLTDALYGRLDLGGEIRAVHAQGLGETVLLRDSEADGGGLSGFAVCHHGPRSEAGAGACLVKFGAVRPARHAERAFASLLDACGALPRRRGCRGCWPG